MKTFGFASAAAAALTGALFASSAAAADLPPIVIKVCRESVHPTLLEVTSNVDSYIRALTSSTRMVPNSSFVV